MRSGRTKEGLRLDVSHPPPFLIAQANGIAVQSQCVKTIGKQAFTVKTPYGDRWIPVAGSHDLEEVNHGVEQVVVGVHGMGRNVYPQMIGDRLNDGSFKAALAIANWADSETAVHAPQMLSNADDPAGQLYKAGAVISHTEGWKGGFPSLMWIDGRFYMDPQCINSFGVMDQFLGHLRKIYPNLKRVVIYGHSAGAQFAQAYLAFGGAHEVLGRDVRLVMGVANSSSYTILNKDRGKSIAEAVAFARRFDLPIEDSRRARDAVFEWPRGTVIPPGASEFVPHRRRKRKQAELLLLGTELYVIAGKGDMDPRARGVRNDLGSLSLGCRWAPELDELMEYGRYARARFFDTWLRELACELGVERLGGFVEVDAGHSTLDVASSESVRVALLGADHVLESPREIKEFIPRTPTMGLEKGLVF